MVNMLTKPIFLGSTKTMGFVKVNMSHVGFAGACTEQLSYLGEMSPLTCVVVSSFAVCVSGSLVAMCSVPNYCVSNGSRLALC